MNWDIALILGTDGLANGAIYLLAGLGLVLVFCVTRVVFVPFGDVVAFAALTLAAIEGGRIPPTVWLVLTLAALAVLAESWGLASRKEFARIPLAFFYWGVLPAIPCLLALARHGHETTGLVNVALSVALVVPIMPLVARLALQPVANSSVLVLLIVSLAVHFLLSGLGLLFFGPEGFRTQPLAAGTLSITKDFSISAQEAIMIASALVLCLLFFLAFEKTLVGKSLRATSVNRVGARLVGIRPARTALWAYGLGSLLAGLIGVLVAPMTTMYYDSGFMIGLKAFVAAVFGGLVSYPLTAAGALAVGMLESFASFWSGAMKDVIVFSLLIPVLMLRSFLSRHAEVEEEEIDQ